METDIHRMLRRALTTLSGQRTHLDRQIAGVTAALQALGDRGTGSSARGRRALAATDGRAPRRRHVSAAARKAASRRMKAYWAKRKAEAAKKAK